MEEIVKVFGLDIKLFLIQLLNFGLVIFILTKILYKPITKILDDRQKVIEDGIKNAQIAEESLKRANEEASKIKEQTTEEVNSLLSKTKKNAEEYYGKVSQDASESKARILKEANLMREKIEKDAVIKAKEEIVKLSILEAEKILKTKLN